MATDINVNQTEENRAERARTGQYYRPHVDILEEGDELVLVADMPGVKSDAIEIDFQDGVLTIEGSVEPRYDDKVNFLLCEYGIGDFYRTFRVSEQIDSNRIHAEYGNGVLTVHLPKVEEAKPRKIMVNAAG
ncbi:MAG: Hsp20/alpha crystallin family protein [Planctomycetia bacterium]|nr:Hsp20/alpha crystallin family protein [Planctomycetia bacterium]